MFDLSERLKLIATNLQPFMQAGGAITAQEAKWWADQLELSAAAARRQQFHLHRMERLLDEMVGDACEQAVANAPPPMRRLRRLRVIEGGRA
jgi:hypothetical protein